MPLTNTQYASVMCVYDDIRSHNQALQTERYNEVVNKCPEYSLIENEIITLSMKEASRRIVSDSSDTDLDEYNLKLKKLIARKAELLASIGKPKDYLDDSCPASSCGMNFPCLIDLTSVPQSSSPASSLSSIK